MTNLLPYHRGKVCTLLIKSAIHIGYCGHVISDSFQESVKNFNNCYTLRICLTSHRLKIFENRMLRRIFRIFIPLSSKYSQHPVLNI
jgi:hypothetical protein